MMKRMELAQRRYRVLAVDDEQPVMSLIDRILSNAYDVVCTTDAEEALRLADAGPRFDVFLLDVMMPSVRGDELSRRLRQRDPDAKILYVTGYSHELFSARSTLWDNEAFLEKPITPNGLREAVSLLLFGRTDGPDTGTSRTAA